MTVFQAPVPGEATGVGATALLCAAGFAPHARLSGLPPGVKQLRAWVTDSRRGMQEGERIPVTDGRAEFTPGAAGFTTVIGARE